MIPERTQRDWSCEPLLIPSDMMQPHGPRTQILPHLNVFLLAQYLSSLLKPELSVVEVSVLAGSVVRVPEEFPPTSVLYTG